MFFGEGTVSGDRDRREVDRYLSEQNVSLLSRVAFVIELLISLRIQDFQAAGRTVYHSDSISLDIGHANARRRSWSSW